VAFSHGLIAQLLSERNPMAPHVGRLSWRELQPALREALMDNRRTLLALQVLAEKQGQLLLQFSRYEFQAGDDHILEGCGAGAVPPIR
jgi:hypothetical protein